MSAHPYYQPNRGYATASDRFAVRRPESQHVTAYIQTLSSSKEAVYHPYGSSAPSSSSSAVGTASRGPERVLTYGHRPTSDLGLRPSRMEGSGLPSNSGRNSIVSAISASTARGGGSGPASEVGTSFNKRPHQEIISEPAQQRAVSNKVPNLRGGPSTADRFASFTSSYQRTTTASFDEYDQRLWQSETRRYFEEPKDLGTAATGYRNGNEAAPARSPSKRGEAGVAPSATEAFLAETAELLLELTLPDVVRGRSSDSQPPTELRNPYIGKRSPRLPMETHASSTIDSEREESLSMGNNSGRKSPQARHSTPFKAQQLPDTRSVETPSSSPPEIPRTGLSHTTTEALKIKAPTSELAKMVLEQVLVQTLEERRRDGSASRVSSQVGRPLAERGARSVSPMMAPYSSVPAVFTNNGRIKSPQRLGNGQLHHQNQASTPRASRVSGLGDQVLHPKLGAAIAERERADRKFLKQEAEVARSWLVHTFLLSDDIERVREPNNRALIASAELRCRREIVVRTVGHIGNTYHHFECSTADIGRQPTPQQRIEKAMSFASPDRAALHNALSKKGTNSHTGEPEDSTPIIPLRLPTTYRDALLVGSTAAARQNGILSEDAWTARMVRLQHVFRYYTHSRPQLQSIVVPDVSITSNSQPFNSLSVTVPATQSVSMVPQQRPSKLDTMRIDMGNFASPSPLTPTASASPINRCTNQPLGSDLEMVVESPLQMNSQLVSAGSNRRPSTSANELKQLIELAARRAQEEDDRFGSCESASPTQKQDKPVAEDSGSGDSYTYEEVWEEEESGEEDNDLGAHPRHHHHHLHHNQPGSGSPNQQRVKPQPSAPVHVLPTSTKAPARAPAPPPISPTKAVTSNASTTPKGGVSPTFEPAPFEGSSRSSLYSLDEDTAEPILSSNRKPSPSTGRPKGGAASRPDDQHKALVYSQVIAKEGHPAIVVSAPPKSRLPDNVVLPSSPPRVNSKEDGPSAYNNGRRQSLVAGNAAESHDDSANNGKKIDSPRAGLEPLQPAASTSTVMGSPQNSYEGAHSTSRPKLAEHQRRLNIVIDTSGTPIRGGGAKTNTSNALMNSTANANVAPSASASSYTSDRSADMMTKVPSVFAAAPTGPQPSSLPSSTTEAASSTQTNKAPPKRMSIFQALGREISHPKSNLHAAALSAASSLQSPTGGSSIGIGGVVLASAASSGPLTNLSSGQLYRPPLVDNTSLAASSPGAATATSAFNASPLKILSSGVHSSPNPPLDATMGGQSNSTVVGPKVGTPLPRTSSSSAHGFSAALAQPQAQAQAQAHPHPLVGLGGVSLGQVYGSGGAANHRQLVASSGLWGQGPLTGFGVHQRGGAFESAEFGELHFEPYQ